LAPSSRSSPSPSAANGPTPSLGKQWAAQCDKAGEPGTEILKTDMDTMRAANKPIARNWDRAQLRQLQFSFNSLTPPKRVLQLSPTRIIKVGQNGGQRST
jgi:hypothetical protein